MKLTATQLLASYAAMAEHAKIKAAHDLEAELSVNQVTIRQTGIVKIQDVRGHTTRLEAHYSTEELLRLLDRGMDARAALDALGVVDLLG